MYSSADEWKSHKCQIVYQSLILILSQTFWLCVFEFHYEEFNLVLIFCGRSPPHLKMFYKKRCWNSHGTNGQWLVFKTTKILSEYIGRLSCLLFQNDQPSQTNLFNQPIINCVLSKTNLFNQPIINYVLSQHLCIQTHITEDTWQFL